MRVELQFTDKEITPWGGMGLMKHLLDRIGFESALRAFVRHSRFRSRTHLS